MPLRHGNVGRRDSLFRPQSVHDKPQGGAASQALRHLDRKTDARDFRPALRHVGFAARERKLRNDNRGSGKELHGIFASRADWRRQHRSHAGRHGPDKPDSGRRCRKRPPHRARAYRPRKHAARTLQKDALLDRVPKQHAVGTKGPLQSLFAESGYEPEKDDTLERQSAVPHRDGRRPVLRRLPSGRDIRHKTSCGKAAHHPDARLGIAARSGMGRHYAPPLLHRTQRRRHVVRTGRCRHRTLAPRDRTAPHNPEFAPCRRRTSLLRVHSLGFGRGAHAGHNERAAVPDNRIGIRLVLPRSACRREKGSHHHLYKRRLHARDARH